MEGIKEDNNVFKLCNILIFLGVVFLPFANLKFAESLPSSIGLLLSYESYLSMYFFLAFALILFFYKAKKRELKDYKTIAFFFLAYLIVNLAIEVHSLIISPYVKEADYSLLPGSTLILFNIAKSLFLSIPDFPCYFFVSVIRQLIFSTKSFAATFFVAYSFFLYYRETKKDYMHDIWKATTISVGYILIFEIVEFAHLLGANWAKELDITIFSILYDVEGTHGWWPPAIWDRVRSIFPEPSYFAYWGSVSLFILLYGVLKGKRRILSLVEYFLLAFVLFCTDSRTGSMLVLGGLSVFVFLFLYGNFKKNLLTAVLIVLCTIIPLLLAAVFLNTTIGFEEDVSSDSTLGKFVESSVTSLEDSSSRSNRSRYAVRNAQISIFKDHPLLGVGENAVGYYTMDILSSLEHKNNEITTWINSQRERGPFVNDIPKLNFYTFSLATGGIIGFLFNTFPFLLTCLLLLIKYLRNPKSDIDSVIILTSCAIIVAFGLSNSWRTNFIYIIVMSFTFLEYIKMRNQPPQGSKHE